MDKYNIKLSKIFRGLFCLLLCGVILWFIYECYLIYLPFAEKLSFKGISCDRIEGRVTELKHDSSGDVSMIIAEYQVGFRKETTYLPAHLWYYEGIEEGSKMTVPYHQKSLDDMTEQDKNMLFILLFVGALFLVRGLILIIGELAASRYFQGLIANKRYVYANMKEVIRRGKKSCAVCFFDGHRFKSKFYRIDEFPFKIGEEVRVYVDIDKNPEKYFVSEI